MEIYVGTYLVIPREKKNKEVFYYVCPTDVTHHKTSYENAKLTGSELWRKFNLIELSLN